MLNLKKVRERKGVKRDDLAKVLGVTGYTVWRWEKGQREPSYKNLLLICQKLNTSLDELFSID